MKATLCLRVTVRDHSAACAARSVRPLAHDDRVLVLSLCVVGADVAELEAGLSALGYGGFTVDDVYDEATAQAVAAWQADLGVKVTGIVHVDDIAVVPHDMRIATHQLALGSALTGVPNPTVLTYTGTSRYVTVPLDIGNQQHVTEGDAATVELLDGTTVDGVVETISKVAETLEEEQFVTISITVEDQSSLGDFDAMPVTLKLVTEERTDVLYVPVVALIALAGGGYGLEVVDGGTTSYAESTPACLPAAWSRSPAAASPKAASWGYRHERASLRASESSLRRLGSLGHRPSPNR